MVYDPNTPSSMPAETGSIGVSVVGTTPLVDKELEELNGVLDEERAIRELSLDDLAAHIMSTFTSNRDARRNSGIEKKILQVGPLGFRVKSKIKKESTSTELLKVSDVLNDDDMKQMRNTQVDVHWIPVEYDIIRD